jgi:hypothetical protein
MEPSTLSLCERSDLTLLLPFLENFVGIFAETNIIESSGLHNESIKLTVIPQRQRFGGGSFKISISSFNFTKIHKNTKKIQMTHCFVYIFA